MFLCITEVVEVTQEINSTGIIPLEALRAHLPKRPHSSCGKVMFSQPSVILFTGRLCVADTHLPPGQTHPLRTDTLCPVHAGIDTLPAATAADGTHPTGMHTCFLLVGHQKVPATSVHTDFIPQTSSDFVLVSNTSDMTVLVHPIQCTIP